MISRRPFLTTTAGCAPASGMPLPAFAQAIPKRGGTLVATRDGFAPQVLFVPPGDSSSPSFTSTDILERLLRFATGTAYVSA